jgi:hypothetical protein
MALDDLARDRKTEASSFALGLRREERLGGTRRILRSDACAVVGDDERDLLTVRPSGDVDLAAGLARLTGVEQEVDESMLDERTVTLDHGQLRRNVRGKVDPHLAEPMVHESHCAARDARRVHACKGRNPTPREVEEASDEDLELLGLLYDNSRGVRRPLIVGDATHKLFGAPKDHPQRRRYLMCDAHRERSHDGCSGRASKTFVTFILDRHDGYFALELELLALIA